MHSWARLRRADERGNVIILFTLLIVGLFGMVAIALDLSQLRQDRAADQLVADAAATAAGTKLADDTQTPAVACRTAWEYFLTNTGDEGTVTKDAVSDGPDRCADFPATCDASTAVAHARGIAGPYTMTITYPVESSDALMDPGAMGAGSQQLVADDGNRCDRVGVRILRVRDYLFAGVFGYDSNTTDVHAVGRVIEDGNQGTSVGLLVLERYNCLAIDIQGSNAFLRVQGTGVHPGYIHADSIGNPGHADNPTDLSNCGKVLSSRGDSCTVTTFDTSGTTAPRIRAEQAPSADADGNRAAGKISVAALSDEAGAVLANAHTPAPRTVDGAPCGDPFGHPRVTRRPVDDRYLAAVRDGWQVEARQRMLWTPTTVPGGWTVVDCSASGTTVTAPRVLVDCLEFNGANTTFSAPDAELVFTGRVYAEGPLTFTDPRKIYIRGVPLLDGLQIQGGTGKLDINVNGLPYTEPDPVCDDRLVQDRTKTTKVVIGQGAFRVTGNGGLRMCATSLIMLDSTGSLTGSSMPSETGVAPYTNLFRGRIRVAGRGTLEWTAPNVTSDPSTAAQHADLEDLAVWTETEGVADDCTDTNLMSCIAGQGNVFLTGVFFLPNANPMRISGTGVGDIAADAQFVVRRLQVAGNGTLRMRNNPADSVPLPIEGGVRLIR